MSAAEDRMVLMEYEAWKDRDVDLSIDAFLQHREDEANTKRVAEALDLANAALARVEAAGDDPDYGDAFDALTDVRNILQADRPWIEDGNITGETRRVYV